MTDEQALIFAILGGTLALFLWGRFRHDIVALAALMACVLTGLTPAEDAFAGFGHPAVITVACVLVLSRGLQLSGAVDVLARALLPRQAGRALSLAALLTLGAALSAFMNNVGAMALLMPVAIAMAARLDLTPGQALMPLAFATILGGTITLVGTPPNLIVSGFRAQSGGGAFGMFDFAPVGLAVALAGVAFVALGAWRLVPARKPAGAEGFRTGAYFTEARVVEGAKADGMSLREIEAALDDVEAQVTGLVRGGFRTVAPHGGRRVAAGDILVMEAEVEGLSKALSALGIELEEQDSRSRDEKDDDAEEKPRDEDVLLREYAVLPDSRIAGRTATQLRLRTVHGVNLLAVSRSGARPKERLRSLRLRTGDLLLMQGPAEALAGFAEEAGCVPLGERELRLPDARAALTAAAIMAAAVGLAALGVLPAAAAFALGMLASMVLGTVPLRDVYTAIDWPVIVLLAALLPVAGAAETTGAAELVATMVVDVAAQGQPVLALAAVLVATMTLSDLVNNAATAAVMSPIALGVAGALGAPPDGFLMAVALGASCAFLTPIGHQNNTLILGPGGFRFGDYWRLGLPVQILVGAVALPVILLVWPLQPGA